MNTITSPNSSYIANFTPTDTIVWYAIYSAGGASSLNNAETITNAFGVVEHIAQRLTLTSSSNPYDLHYNISFLIPMLVCILI